MFYFVLKLQTLHSLWLFKIWLQDTVLL